MCNQSAGLYWNLTKGGGSRKAGVRGRMDHWLEYLPVPSAARGNDAGEAWREETGDAELSFGHSKSKIPTGLRLEGLRPRRQLW